MISKKESQNFGLIRGYERRTFTDEKGNIVSQAPSIFSAAILTVDESVRQREDISVDMLVKRLRSTFMDNKRRYIGYEWDHGNLEIVDLVIGESFQVVFEDWRFIIYPKDKTGAETVRKAGEQITQHVIPLCILSVICEQLP
jgi:hypothetical protein